MLTHRFPSKEEFAIAKERLAKMDTVKLDRKASGLTYSFLHHLEKERVYALSHEKIAHKGGQSQHVKILYNESKSIHIAKVAVFSNIVDPYNLPEVQILEKLGRLHNVILRPLEHAQPFKIFEGTTQEQVVYVNYKLYLIQTKIPGINLLDWLSIPQNRTYLSSYPEMKYQIAFKLIARLHQLHTLGIVHGDIKPANIVLTIDKHNEVQLEFVDFGSSVLLTEQRHETMVHYQCGTPRYRAPELESKQPNGFILGYAGDVYSLSFLLQNNLYLLLPNKSITQFLTPNRTERGSLAQLTACIFEELSAYDALHSLTNPTLKMLLKYFKTVALNAKSLQKSLQILKSEFSKEQAILADIISDPSENDIKNLTHAFNIQKPKTIISFRQSCMDQEYNTCLSLLTKWRLHRELESFIDSMKSKQKLLEDKAPFCQLYTSLLQIIRHAQGNNLIEQLNHYYPLNTISEENMNIPIVRTCTI